MCTAEYAGMCYGREQNPKVVEATLAVVEARRDEVRQPKLSAPRKQFSGLQIPQFATAGMAEGQEQRLLGVAAYLNASGT